jgi:hypothetical protein
MDDELIDAPPEVEHADRMRTDPDYRAQVEWEDSLLDDDGPVE